jgi:O-antigen/teichoic acid export membrane protein
MRKRRHSNENAPVSGDAASLKGKVVGGIGWNLAAQVVVQTARLSVGIVLARLLSPQDFGLVGMAFVFVNLGSLFTDLSFGAALIQREDITEEDRSTVFWTTVGVGVLCTGIGVAASGAVASFYDQERVGPLFAALSAGFTLSAVAATQTALLTRELAYRSLQLREIAAVLAGAVAGISVAVAGYGAWAIVIQSLAASACSVVLLWSLSPWRPRLIYSVASLRDVGGFGIKLFASRVLAYANTNCDNLLVGRFLGAAALGSYSLAYNVMYTPMLRIGLPFQQVVFPAYARLQADTPRLVAAWIQSKRLSAAVLAPSFLAILVVAPDLVPVAFGDKWHDVVPVLQLLCVAGVAHSLVTLNWSFLQARGEAGTLFRLNVLVTVVTLAAFAAGLHWGIVGVAAWFAAAKWALVLPDTWLTCRSASASALQSLRASSVAAPVAALAAALAYGFRLGLVEVGVGAPWRLGLVLLFGAAAYAGLVVLLVPALVRELQETRATVARSRAQPAT